MYKPVIHLPQRAEDTEKLMREISRFRADKVLSLLREQGITPEQLQGLLNETEADKS